MLVKTLRVPWTARRSNQCILKKISPESSLEGLMLNTLATWCEELTQWKRFWCWERLKAGGEGDDRGWDGWMASLTQWTWLWASSGSWWWTGKPGVLQSTGSPRVRHYWATELQWISEYIMIFLSLFFNTELNLEVLFLLITPAISPSKCPLTSSVL